MAFGHYLRRQREEREMTLTELARRVEISIATYRERENPGQCPLLAPGRSERASS